MFETQWTMMMMFALLLCLLLLRPSEAFASTPMEPRQGARRVLARVCASAVTTSMLFGFGSNKGSNAAATARLTNAIVSTKGNIRQKRLGNSDIIVSEVGLGTQRWVSDDSNAPDEATCHKFIDKFIAKGGNLIDTAEQYPIPSSSKHPEGDTEKIIGNYISKNKASREKLVLSTKITGGRNVNRANIAKDLEGSLRRMQTDYVDVYLLHWPARYSPQSNWGQSLSYNQEMEKYYAPTPFEEIVEAMGKLIKEGKIRGYGFCNDNCYGLTKASLLARQMGVPGPVCLQGDYSLIDRKSDENGVAEAASSVNENVGFMAYNVLAGGFLTDKYVDAPVPYDNPSFGGSRAQRAATRGRHDMDGWGRTLYRYRSDPAKEAIEQYRVVAREAGISLLELSLRWARERKLVTTSLLGVSTEQQLDQDLAFYGKPPLSDESMWQVDRVHMRHRNPIFSSTRVGKDWFGEGEIGEAIP